MKIMKHASQVPYVLVDTGIPEVSSVVVCLSKWSGHSNIASQEHVAWTLGNDDQTAPWH